MEHLKPDELANAARVADGLVYVVGLAGVVAGAQLFREGDLPLAIVAWVLTFVAGAVLRLVVWMARGLAQVMETTARTEADVLRLNRLQGADAPQEEDPRGYGRGGWH